jgi:hypothetical protein
VTRPQRAGGARSWAVATIVAGILCVGCETPPASKDAASSAASVLAATKPLAALSDVRLVPGNFEKPIRLDVTPASDVADIGGSRRFVAGVSLPPFTGPYSIELLSTVKGTAKDPIVLYPEVWFVDADFSEVRRISWAEWRAGATLEGRGLITTVFVNDDSRRERSLLVTSFQPNAEDLLLHNTNATMAVPIVVPVPGGILTFMMPAGSSDLARITAVPTGELVVRLKPYKLRKIGETP